MKTKSTTSPKNSKKGCLCEDGTYSTKCCEGELINQGIGQETGGTVSQVTNTNQPRTITGVRG